jgi:hypothetical protein
VHPFSSNYQLDAVVMLDSLLCASSFYYDLFYLLIFIMPENFLFLIKDHKEFDIGQNQLSPLRVCRKSYIFFSNFDFHKII